ncbi:mitochondrial ribosome-associated GTPase 1-like [Saccoglossus kowalevskii]|uniref:Mitochondrial GTPase 1 n=1 Tax=Saccoglossus kowalevskii TaxID=10224 RepID=A0ABM0M0M0_SACKO|nr:PREDICTED: mitochondrial ribosome-associated GTPase 1-like [Saccoglossus kowalevskii]
MSTRRIISPGSTVGRLFRESFTFGHKETTYWFPSHMARGMKKMQAMLRKMDCVLEVHDARIPLTGRNPMFKKLLGVKPHLLVLNKMDLIDLSKRNEIKSKLAEQGVDNVLFTNCNKQESRTIKHVVKHVTEMIEESERYQRSEEENYNLMVVGIPNVGKSSVINAMRRMHLKKGKATRVGAIPGITRGVLKDIQVSNRPPIYLVDTPGIMDPHIPGIEAGMKLALCATLHDHHIGCDVVADYLLFWLNKHSKFEYVEEFELEEPTDDIIFLMTHLAKKAGKMQYFKTLDGSRELRPNLDASANYILRLFRQGRLGKHIIDLD